MHKGLLVVVATTAALLPVTTAVAADHNVGVSAAAPSAQWDGAAGDGVQGSTPCAPPDAVCDAGSETTLIKVDDPGTLTVTTAGSGPNTQDVDLDIYASDADGARGDLISSSAGSTADENAGAPVPEPGYYLAVVTSFTSVQGGYHGTATLTPDTVEWAPGAPARHSALDKDHTTLSWSANVVNYKVGFYCDGSQLAACDYTLLHLTEPGDLAVDVTTTNTTAMDELRVYNSDAAGHKLGDPFVDELGITDPTGTPGAPVSGSGTGLEPGYYLVSVAQDNITPDPYSATATFTPFVPEDESGA